MFVLSFRNGKNGPKDSFDKYYMSLAEIKGFNALVANKYLLSVCEKQVRSAWKTCWNVKK